MLSCTDVEALWVARGEGVLAPADEERLRAHVTSCGPCACLEHQLALLEYDLEVLAEEPTEAPPYLKARILARLEAAAPRRPWSWRQLFSSRRVLALSTAWLAFFAGLLTREIHRLNDWVGRAGPQEVVLDYRSSTAALVTLAGDFNEWGRNARRVRVERAGDRWLFRVRVEPGRYQYAFVVDGKKWLPDPQAPGIIPDGFGGMNSVLYVQGRGARKTDAF